MGIIKNADRSFDKWVHLQKDAKKKYHIYEIAKSKERKAWEYHLKVLRSMQTKKGRK